jgi:hypothetical protein
MPLGSLQKQTQTNPIFHPAGAAKLSPIISIKNAPFGLFDKIY